jgi:multicomponent K+:H+ antiporter subunit G
VNVDLHEWAVAVLLLVGSFFTLVGAIGLVRLPDFFMRLHGPTKATTLGVGGVLLAAIVQAASAGFAMRELLIAVFLFMTAPVSAYLMAQAGLRLRLPSKAPLPDIEGASAAPQTSERKR